MLRHMQAVVPVKQHLCGSTSHDDDRCVLEPTLANASLKQRQHTMVGESRAPVIFGPASSGALPAAPADTADFNDQAKLNARCVSRFHAHLYVGLQQASQPLLQSRALQNSARGSYTTAFCYCICKRPHQQRLGPSK